MVPQSSRGEKRRFIAFGLLNIVVTNALLQFLLSTNLGTGLATLVSQIVNLTLGYVLYGTQVFRVARLGHRTAFFYGLWSLLAWWFNWAGINALSYLGWPRRLSALVLIPVLAIASYIVQKKLVFSQGTHS